MLLLPETDSDSLFAPGEIAGGYSQQHTWPRVPTLAANGLQDAANGWPGAPACYAFDEASPVLLSSWRATLLATADWSTLSM